MYLKQLEDPSLKKPIFSSLGGKIKDTLHIGEKAKFIKSIRYSAICCKLFIDEKRFPLENFDLTELQLLDAILEKINCSTAKGLAAVEQLIKEKSTYAKLFMDDKFSINVTLTEILKKEEEIAQELNNKAEEEISRLKDEHKRINDKLREEKKELTKNLKFLEMEKKQTIIERDNLFKSITNLVEVNKKIEPFIKIINKPGKGYTFTFEVEREFLDVTIESYKKEISDKQALLEKQAGKIDRLNQNKENILKYLKDVDKYLDKHQDLINGKFNIDNEDIKEIVEFLRLIINKKMTLVIEANKKIGEITAELNLNRLEAEKLELKIKNFETEIVNLRAEVKSLINKYETYKALVKKIFSEFKEKAKEHKIFIDITKNNELIWDDNLLVNKLEELAKKFNEEKEEKLRLEAKKATLYDNITELKRQQQELAAESLSEKENLNQKIEYYEKKIKSYESQLAEAAIRVTRSLFLMYYGKTAHFFDVLIEEGKLLFSDPKARQLFAIYLCANADKNGEKALRSKTFQFLINKNIRSASATTKFFNDIAGYEIFKADFVSGTSALNVTVLSENSEYALLPEKEWEEIRNTAHECFPSIVLDELLPIFGVVYKNNEYNNLIERVKAALFQFHGKKLKEVNNSLQTLVKNLFLESNIKNRQAILKNWWESNELAKFSTVCEISDSKTIIINFNKDTVENFRSYVNRYSVLLSEFSNKYSLDLDIIKNFFHKQYLFFDDQFKDLLSQNDNKYNIGLKNKFYRIFNDEKLNVKSNIFNPLSGITALYLTATSLFMFAFVYPVLYLQIVSFGGSLIGFMIATALYLAISYFVLKKTGFIRGGIREARFYKKTNNEFINTIKNMNFGGELAGLPQKIALTLWNNKNHYAGYVKGLMQYFRFPVSQKMFENSWDDVVRSLLHGQFLGVLGNLAFDSGKLNRITELISILVISDILKTNNDSSLDNLSEKIKTYYNLKKE